MYSLHPASLPPYDAELSRRAAARYAVLAAVKERRSQQRHASRRPPTGPGPDPCGRHPRVTGSAELLTAGLLSRSLSVLLAAPDVR